MTPTITLKDKIFTITLMRAGKPVVYKFTRMYHIILYSENETDLDPSQREKIVGPAFNGVVYWIDVCFIEQHYIWISKEEFDILYPMLSSIYDHIHMTVIDDLIHSQN